MAEETKKPTTKKGVRRNAPLKAASSPVPEGAVASMNTCGHGGCGSACRVRYVGQTSHLRDHYAMHAARGVTHVWSAAIITGLAVVLTGAIGYSAVQAKDYGATSSTQQWNQSAASPEMQALQARLDAVQQALEALQRTCGVRGGSSTSSGMGGGYSSTTHGGTGYSGSTSSQPGYGSGSSTTSSDSYRGGSPTGTSDTWYK